jgi:hypothetical protein
MEEINMEFSGIISPQEIKEKMAEIAEVYPLEANYCSQATLWRCGLDAGMCSRELYDAARSYYGRLWNYVGD